MRPNSQLPLPALIISVVVIILLLPFILFISAIAIVYALITKRRIKKMFAEAVNRQKKPQTDDKEGRVIDHNEINRP
jgi:hypothetical protein